MQPGPLDNFGVTNPGSNSIMRPTPISLDGYYLSDNYGNLTAGLSPRARSSNSFGDSNSSGPNNQPTQTHPRRSAHQLPLDPVSGSIALSAWSMASPDVDYLNYSDLGPDFPMAICRRQPFDRQIFYTASPRAANFAPPINVFSMSGCQQHAYPHQSTAPTPTIDELVEIYNALDTRLIWRLLPHRRAGQQDAISYSGRLSGGAARHLLVWADGLPNLKQPDPSGPARQFQSSPGVVKPLAFSPPTALPSIPSPLAPNQRLQRGTIPRWRRGHLHDVHSHAARAQSIEQR